MTNNLYQFFEKRSQDEEKSIKPMKLPEEALPRITEVCTEEELSPAARKRFKEIMAPIEEEKSPFKQINSHGTCRNINSNDTEFGSHRDQGFSYFSFKSS